MLWQYGRLVWLPTMVSQVPSRRLLIGKVSVCQVRIRTIPPEGCSTSWQAELELLEQGVPAACWYSCSAACWPWLWPLEYLAGNSDW
jgi:hypothetical protein